MHRVSSHRFRRLHLRRCNHCRQLVLLRQQSERISSRHPFPHSLQRCPLLICHPTPRRLKCTRKAMPVGTSIARPARSDLLHSQHRQVLVRRKFPKWPRVLPPSRSNSSRHHGPCPPKANTIRQVPLVSIPSSHLRCPLPGL